jgi:hypothetical protein
MIEDGQVAKEAGFLDDQGINKTFQFRRGRLHVIDIG